MVKVKVKGDAILVYNGVNYYGGQEAEVPDTIVSEIVDKATPVDMHNAVPIIDEPKKTKKGKKDNKKTDN